MCAAGAFKVERAAAEAKAAEVAQQHASALAAEREACAQECRELAQKYAATLAESKASADSVAGITGRLLLTNDERVPSSSSASVGSHPRHPYKEPAARYAATEGTPEAKGVSWNKPQSSSATSLHTQEKQSAGSVRQLGNASALGGIGSLEGTPHAAVARAQARLLDLSEKLRERERVLQQVPPGSDAAELTIEVGLLQAQITRLQQVRVLLV